MEFDWDENKNQYNFAKHGIAFEEALEIFKTPMLTISDDRYEYGEIREYSIGAIDFEIVLAVIHTDRSGVTRLISARKANSKERKQYYEYLKKAFGSH